MTPQHWQSPLRGRYLVRDRLPNAALGMADAVLRVLTRLPGIGPGRPARESTPHRVLLAVGGHLGDAVIATSAISVVRGTLPDVAIGILAPSWCRVVFDGHPDVRWFHAVDHWKPSRADAPFATRFRTYATTALAAIGAMKEVRYDTAVDLYPYYPNAAPLLWRAGIPERIGFSSGGFGPLYSRALEWHDGGRHTAARHVELLEAAKIGRCTSDLRYSLPPVTPAALTAATTLLEQAGCAKAGYVVIHMGAGDPRKEWVADHWCAVARELGREGHRMVLTGAGAREREATARLAEQVPSAVDLCDRCSWDEFRVIVSGARLVLSVDTVVAHLAAASGRPSVVLMGDMANPEHWRPLGNTAMLLTHALPASIRDIQPAAVLAAARGQLLEAHVA